MRAESPSYFLRLGTIISVGLGLVFLSQGGMAPALRQGIFLSLRPGLQVLRFGRVGGQRMLDGWRFVFSGAERLARSEFELSQQRVWFERLRELEKENDLLRKELGRDQPGKITLAFYGSGHDWFIDGGCHNGVEQGAPVFFQGSFLGVVGQVDRYFSTVQTVGEPDFRLPVKAGSASGLLESAQGVTAVTQLSAGDSLVEGEAIVTVGSGRVPGGLPIGRVTMIRRDEALGTTQAVVEPYFRLSQMEFVEVEKESGAKCP